MRALDYLLLKKKEFQNKIKYFKRKGKDFNTRFMINVNGESLDAVDHFKFLLQNLEDEISKIKRKEYRILGTAFVTFTDEISAKEATKIFNTYRKTCED